MIMPKEKAKELYFKFLQYVPAEEEFEHEYAINCALIAVDRNIKILTELVDKMESYETRQVFWKLIKEEQEVKKELEDMK